MHETAAKNESATVSHAEPTSNSCNLLPVYTKMAFAFETRPAAKQTLLTKPLPAFTSERNSVYPVTNLTYT